MKEKIYAILSILILITINSIIVPPLGYSFITPCIPVAGFIYWLLNKKYLFNNLSILLIGLFNDLIMGTPIGSSIIFYFFVKLFIDFLDQKLLNKNIITAIIKSYLAISLYFILIYIFIIIYYKKYPSINYFFMSYLLTVFIFPAIYIIFSWILKNRKIEEK